MNEYRQAWITSNDHIMLQEMRTTFQVIPQARLEHALLAAERYQPELSMACLTPKVIDKLASFITGLPAKPEHLEGYQLFRLTGIYNKRKPRATCMLTPYAAQLVPAFAEALKANPSAPHRNIFIWTFVDAAQAGDETGLANLALALGDKSKPTRAMVVEQLRALDRARVQPHVEPLLKAKRKATREAAAAVLDTSV